MKDIPGESLSSNRFTTVLPVPIEGRYGITQVIMCTSFRWKEVFFVDMVVLKETAPTLHTNGIGYSIPPRCRTLEMSTYPLENSRQERDIKYYGKNGGATQGYVIAINRTGITPDAGFRDPRQPFLGSDTVQQTFDLQDKSGSAQIHFINAVTGPYIAGEKDWHGMFLVTREEKPVPTFGALHAEEITTLQGVIGKTLQFMRQNNPRATNFVGFSFSPLENLRTMEIAFPDGVRQALFPRSPVQNLATIHGHAVMIDPSHIRSRPITEGKKFDKRMTKEPQLERLLGIFHHLIFTPIQEEFPDIAFEYAEHTDIDSGFPKGSFITVDSKTLENPRMGEFMKRLHQQYEDIYWRIADTIVYKEALINGQVIMRPKEEKEKRINALLTKNGFKDLPDNVKRFFQLIGKLQDPNTILSPNMSIAERAQAIERFVLLGPAYNVLYYQPSEKSTTIAIVPRWLSGASPLETIGIFKDQQIVDEAAFQPFIAAQKETGRRLLHHLHLPQDRQRRIKAS